MIYIGKIRDKERHICMDCGNSNKFFAGMILLGANFFIVRDYVAMDSYIVQEDKLEPSELPSMDSIEQMAGKGFV